MATSLDMAKKIKNGNVGPHEIVKSNDTANDILCRLIRVSSYFICLGLFLANTFAIFQTFASDIKIRSTKVVSAPEGFLESPTILVCNTSAYKEQILHTNWDEYRNNTIKLNDILVDALVIHDAGHGPLSFQPISIKDSVKEIATMLYGNCLMIDKHIRVS